MNLSPLHCLRLRFFFNLKDASIRIIDWISCMDEIFGAVNNMPNIFKCLEADVLGGRLGSKK